MNSPFNGFVLNHSCFINFAVPKHKGCLVQRTKSKTSKIGLQWQVYKENDSILDKQCNLKIFKCEEFKQFMIKEMRMNWICLRPWEPLFFLQIVTHIKIIK